jgi:hypothetical protein
MPQTRSPEAERQDLYQAIGEATTAWARVEDEVAALFTFFVAGNASGLAGLSSMAATAAFHAVINFNSRLAMTDRAADWSIFGRNRQRWQTISNRLGRQSKKRNNIVHFSLIRSGPIPGGPFRYYLSPSLQNVTIHLSGKDPPRLSAADIRRRAESFRELAKAVSDFAILIGARNSPQARLPGFDEPPASAPDQDKDGAG